MTLLRSSLLLLTLAACASNTPAPPAKTEEQPTGVAGLRWQVPRVAELIKAPLVDEFLGGVAKLPAIAGRTLYRNKDKSKWYTKAEYDALPPAEQSALEKMEIDEETYYTTRYGTPISYARPLQILSERGVTSVRGKKILDFGYGYVGHLRLFALAGADAHGVDVDPMLTKLYSEPGDQGVIDGAGKITLHSGKYPADATLVQEIGEGYDIFISKNVLKLGYIHPRREADPKRLIDLGVTDEQFLAALHKTLVPGGLALVYNLSPAQAPADQPYLPWADGETAFARELWEKAGFTVHVFDRVDHAEIRALAQALGWHLPYGGEPGMDVEKDLFAWYTLAEKNR